MNENELKAYGLKLAIEEVERLLNNAQNLNYKMEYKETCKEILIYLNAMYSKIIKGNYHNPVTDVG